ncbi:MAG: zinc ribbon domain-containing protein, partial [Oscillospiraceae bacterium]|nr:zinc ribbon domain-containing protein [Oscillospiraceae bacterium]
PRSVYTGKIYCGQCGSKFRRKVCGGKIYWDCYPPSNTSGPAFPPSCGIPPASQWPFHARPSDW